MLGWLHHLLRHSTPASRLTFQQYFNAVVIETDAQFLASWRFDLHWVGLIHIAKRLDAIKNNTEKMDQIARQITAQYRRSSSVADCALIMLLTHSVNQRQLAGLISARRQMAPAACEPLHARETTDIEID